MAIKLYVVRVFNSCYEFETNILFTFKYFHAEIMPIFGKLLLVCKFKNNEVCPEMRAFKMQGIERGIKQFYLLNESEHAG